MFLLVNGTRRELAEPWADESLLVVLREALGLWGAKYGCGKGECGACTVLVDGRAEHACTMAARDAAGRAITTIEGLAAADGALHPLQQAWIDERVAQCGFCQAGQIVRAAALLREDPRPTRAAIDDAMAGNLCRCGTYSRIRRAIERAASPTPAAPAQASAAPVAPASPAAPPPTGGAPAPPPARARGETSP